MHFAFPNIPFPSTSTHYVSIYCFSGTISRCHASPSTYSPHACSYACFSFCFACSIEGHHLSPQILHVTASIFPLSTKPINACEPFKLANGPAIPRERVSCHRVPRVRQVSFCCFVHFAKLVFALGFSVSKDKTFFS